MFERFYQFIKDAELKGLHIMISPHHTEGQLCVIVSPESGELRVNNPALKAALSQPLNVIAPSADIDQYLIDAIREFCDTYTTTAVLDNSRALENQHQNAVTANDKNNDDNTPTECTADNDVDVDPELF